MDIIIRNSGGVPIYDQITRQMKGLILRGELKEGEALPSMRLLAKELRISVITTKRAYEELEREGFLTTVPGKGCFVAPQNPELVREDTLRRAEEHLSHAVDVAKAGGVTLAEPTETPNLLYGDETLGKTHWKCPISPRTTAPSSWTTCPSPYPAAPSWA